MLNRTEDAAGQNRLRDGLESLFELRDQDPKSAAEPLMSGLRERIRGVGGGEPKPLAGFTGRREPRFPLFACSEPLPAGEAQFFAELSGHLRRRAGSEAGWLFLRPRASHLTASRLAEHAKQGETGYYI
jgi:hypothetical protein